MTLVHGSILIFSICGLMLPQEPPPGNPATARILVGFAEGPEAPRVAHLGQLREALQLGRREQARARIRDLEAMVAAEPGAFLTWLGSVGGIVRERFWIVNGAVIEIPADRVSDLRGHPEIRFVEEEQALTAHIKAATNSSNHNADFVQLSLGLRGEGTALALLDSGVNLDYQGSGSPHPAFNKPGVGGGTRVFHTVGIADPLKISDEHGHGTAVAGVALARDWAAPPVMSDDGFAPRAGLASYRITVDGTLHTTCGDLTAGWQRVLEDLATMDISVANCSYRGSPDPLCLAQRALDTLCYVGDVLVVTSAGNDGKLSHPTAFSQANVNGLSVGAVAADSHEVAEFSSYGPPRGDGNRFFPDLVAVGKSVRSVPRDSSGVAMHSGTSFAAPMVAGTALLVRQARSDFDFRDTKAVILNNLQDISGANTGLGRQNYGLGMLRSDLAVDAAQNGTMLRGKLVEGTDQRQDFTVVAVGGRDYTATLVWARTAMHTPDWDDLDLLVLDPAGFLVAGSATPRNVYERVRFRAGQTGAYTLVVRSDHMIVPETEFSLAFGINLGGGGEEGHYGTLGAACSGSGADPAAGLIRPPLGAAPFGNGRTRVPLAYYPTRLQQAFDSAWFPTSYEVHKLAFRRDQDQGTSAGLKMSLEIYLGYTTKAINALDTRFDVNPVPGTMVKVFEDTAFDLAGIANAPGVDQFDYVLPLTQPFTVDTSGGRNLLMEVRVVSHTAGSEPVQNWFDAVQDAALGRVYTTGNPLGNVGVPDDVALVVSFMGPDTGPVKPRLTWEGVPELADPFAVVLRQARPNTVAALLHGRSILTWGSAALPLDLGPLGALGCSLHVEPFVMVPTMVDGGGQGRVDFTIPNDPALTGTLFFNQFAVLDPLANGLGLVMTNAGFGLVGR